MVETIHRMANQIRAEDMAAGKADPMIMAEQIGWLLIGILVLLAIFRGGCLANLLNIACCGSAVAGMYIVSNGLTGKTNDEILILFLIVMVIAGIPISIVWNGFLRTIIK